MGLIWTNFARAKLATPPSGTGGLSFTVEAGKGALFPTLGAGDYCYAVFKNSAKTAAEVVKVEARSTDSFTIAAAGRGLDGTTAASWTANDYVELCVTRIALLEVFNAAVVAIGALTPAANKGIIFTGPAAASLFDLSAFALTLLDDSDSAVARTTLGAMAGNAISHLANGRPTLVSGSAVPAADQTAKTTVYYTPFRGDRIALYDGSNWGLVTFTEKSVAVPATTSTPFDIFGYISGGTLALETVNWTNDTTRATALVVQNGVLVKSGDATRRYLGTGRTTSVSGQCEDSAAKRFLWSYNNRVKRALRKAESTSTWTYGTATWRRVNGNGSDNMVEFIVGVAEDALSFQASGIVSNDTATVRGAYTGIGIDSNTTPSGTQGFAAVTNTVAGQMSARHEYAYLTPGYHYAAALEIGAGADTQTFSGNSLYQSITGEMLG